MTGGGLFVPGVPRDAERIRNRLSSSAVQAKPESGPLPPPAWAPAWRRLVECARRSWPAPFWWSTTAPFCGHLETWTWSSGADANGGGRPNLGRSPAITVLLSLAGEGHFQVQGQVPELASPGKALFVSDPVRHRTCLPVDSPGWSFAWLAIYHPYLRERLGQQVLATGPVVDIQSGSALAESLLRLVRGAIMMDFRDQFAAEIALFEFVLTFDRWAQQAREGGSEGQRWMDESRRRALARLPKALAAQALAAEFGMSRSHFSYVFHQRTGLSPARFLAEVRIDKAARMLLDTGEPVKTIAAACGFANPNHFAKVFRRLRQQTPAAFRRAHGKSASAQQDDNATRSDS
jgi:AraC-like DNA-binding protein